MGSLIDFDTVDGLVKDIEGVYKKYSLTPDEIHLILDIMKDRNQSRINDIKIKTKYNPTSIFDTLMARARGEQSEVDDDGMGI